MHPKQILTRLYGLFFLLALCATCNGQYGDTQALAWFHPESPISEGDEFNWSSELGEFAFVQSQSQYMPTVNDADTDILGFRSIVFNNSAALDLNISLANPHTIICVFKGEENNLAQQFLFDTPSRLFQFYNSNGTAKSGSQDLYSSLFAEQEYHILCKRIDEDGEVKVFENTIEIDLGNEERSIDGILRLGSSINYDRFLAGKVAELLIYDIDLEDTEIQDIINELMFKYSPPFSLGEDGTLLDECPYQLVVEDRFKTYEWKRKTTEGAYIGVGDTHILNTEQSGEYVLNVLDIFDRTYTDTVVLYSPDYSDLINSTICSASTYEIDLAISDSSIDVVWSDESLSGSAVQISEPGEYSVTLTQSDGCSYQSEPFLIEDIEVLTEIVQPDLFCQGNALNAEIEGFSGISYTWSTDEETPSIVPETDGTYWVEAVNVNGCVGRDTVDVAFAGVAPNAEYSTGAICEDNLVVFADATAPEEGVITESLWNIQSENESESEEFSGEEIVYEAGEPGDLYVSLLVTLDNGCTGLVRDTLTVSPLPLVGFNYDEVIACRENEVAYESETGVPGGGGISQYRWDFGNGEIDFGLVGSTVFEEMGVNTVKHIVRTTAGCVDSLEADIVVLGSPVVDFVFDTVCVGSPTGFYEVVDVSESGPVFYQWSFGDGFTSNFPNTSHEYADAGTYVVTLTATGNNFGNAGCMDAATKTVSVFESPDAEITTMDGCLNEGGVLVDETEWASTGGQADPIASRTWRLESNGQVIGTDSVVYYLPEGPGNYAVTFAFETAAGCAGEANGSVEVLALPVSSFEVTWPFVEPPVEVEIVNASEDATAYSWFLDGVEVSTAFEPTIVLPAGDFVIDLVASNVLGCADTSSQAGTVIVPEYDIAIIDIYYNRVGSRLELSALIGNNGNVPITSFDMEVQIGRDINYRESVETLIPAGELIEYSLDADFQYVPGRVLPYTCITLSNPNGAGENETDLTNNEVCIGLDKEKATFIPPYPNPASELVNLGFVMPRDGVVEVEMVSSEGRVVYSRAISLLKGYDVVEVDLRNFSEGMYYLRYEYGGVSEVFKVVIGN